LYFGVRVLHLP